MMDRDADDKVIAKVRRRDDLTRNAMHMAYLYGIDDRAADMVLEMARIIAQGRGDAEAYDMAVRRLCYVVTDLVEGEPPF